jgi:hypothetical protein
MEKEDKYKGKMTLIGNQRQNLLFGLNKHEERQVQLSCEWLANKWEKT